MMNSVAVASQGRPFVRGDAWQRLAGRDTSVIDACRDAGRGWHRGGPMLRLIDAALTGAPSTKCRRAAYEGNEMLRIQPASAEREDAPDDRAMHIIEVGLAIVAIVAAGILALLR